MLYIRQKPTQRLTMFSIGFLVSYQYLDSFLVEQADPEEIFNLLSIITSDIWKFLMILSMIAKKT